LFYIYCFRAGHLYTCQQCGDVFMILRCKKNLITNLAKINISRFSSITRLGQRFHTTFQIFFFSNRVIELNQKILILKRFVSKNVFLCDDNWILYRIFCSIELCCSWRFDEKLFVFKYCFIFIVLGLDVQSHD
jgi:hypothetical protein